MENNKYSLEKVEWSDVFKIAEDMYKDNKFLSAYTDPSFLDMILDSSNLRMRKDYKMCTFHTYMLKKNEKPIFIIPLYESKKEKKIFLGGHFHSIGHLDFIYYSNVTLIDFKILLAELSCCFPKYTLVLDRISSFSKTHHFFDILGVESVEKEKCVKIDFDTYDDWFSRLNKGHRQNIRTAYNRIDREKKSVRFECYFKKKPPKEFYNSHMKLFSKRMLEHSHLSSLYYFPLLFIKKHEKLSKALLNYENVIFCGLFINKKLVASLNGVLSNDGRAIITRLSIEKKFGVYCPGGLLINETIKTITSSHHGVKSLDLSRGDERYKYVYGGCDHFNYLYLIFLGDYAYESFVD